MNHSTLSRIAMAALLVLAGAATLPAAEISCSRTADSYVTRSLTDPPTAVLPSAPVLRFAQLSDVHLYDDDASAALTGSALEDGLEPTIGNGSAQRLQDEYTDEVLNAMVNTINVCNTPAQPLELMIATGDNTDNMLLNELRRYIDNLDGASGQDTAYEANCGYTVIDPNQHAKLGGAVACPAGLADLLKIPTGKVVADSQSPPPDLNDPSYQFATTRSPRQVADTMTASLSDPNNLSFFMAPGLPPSLQCDQSTLSASCNNHKLAIPYYAVFGNHDGANRGTLTFQAAFEAAALAHGRYWLQSQREWINEFFYTSGLPVGHGFKNVESARFDDPDDRNDGYYEFAMKNGAVVPTGTAGAVRLIVINTLYDGVEKRLHGNGTDALGGNTMGLVDGSEATNPVGLEAGYVSTEQAAWLDGRLQDALAKGQPVLVFSHHPDRSFIDRQYGFPTYDGVTADAFDMLLGKYGNVVAHIAGHTHENVIRACTPSACARTLKDTTTPAGILNAFWRVETASLIDYPQEGRIIELYAVGGGKYALKLTMISPDQNDPQALLSHNLSIAEATCNASAILRGPLNGGDRTPERFQQIAAGGEAAVQGNFCQGVASLGLSDGAATDRDVILLP